MTIHLTPLTSAVCYDKQSGFRFGYLRPVDVTVFFCCAVSNVQGSSTAEWVDEILKWGNSNEGVEQNFSLVLVIMAFM